MPFHSTNYRLNLSFSLDLIHLLIRIGVFFLLSQVIVIHKKYSMKFNGIMVFVLIFLSKFFMFAQDPVCGIASGPSGLQSFQEYDPELASSNFCIKVYFILYGDRDENNNCVDLVPLGRQNSVINDLNSAFPSSIQFYYDETETEIYCEKDLISLTNACGYLNNDFGIQKPTDGIIIHLASDNVAPGGPNGFAKSIPSKEFYVGSTDNGVPNSKNKGLLAHEMGHCLGLHHTFFGEPSVGQPPCDEVRDCDGTIIASSNPDSNDGISSTGRDPNGDTNDCEAITNNGKCNDPNYSYPDIPFDNYMSYYWDCIERFTSDQINRMKFEIENMFGSNPLESCCKLPQNADHIISEDEEWDSDDDVSKVTIEQGATLTVSSGAVISFDAAGEIIIDGGQLILNNATLQLSSSCGDNQWQGIKMSGCGNQIQSDNSTIRDAAVGIHIENMNNCGTVALDMDEGSSIENCTRGLLIQNSIAQFDLTETYFRDNNIAVEVIEGGNLVFDDCHFDNNGFFDAEPTVEFDPIGIRLVNAKVDFLESNLFDNTTLFAWGTHPMSPRLKIGESEKDKCTFTGGNGYYLLATSGVSGGLAFMVENTRFLNALYGNFFWGANEYLVRRTLYEKSITIASRAINTGSDQNSHQCNQFNSSNLNYFGMNENTDFLENDFESPSQIVAVPSSLFNQLGIPPTKVSIGLEGFGAANCFVNKNASLNISQDYDLTYHYFDDSQTTKPCQEINASQNYDKERVLDFINNCQNNGIFTRINPDGDAEPGILYDTDWSTHITHMQVLNKISHYEQALAAADSSWQSANAQVQSIQDTLDEWINYALFRSEKVGDSSLAIQALTPLPAFKYKEKLVGVYLEKNLFNAVDSLLNSLVILNSAESQFVEVQEINLRYLRGDTSDPISVTDIERLKEMVYEPYPAAGYAYGLYYKLTGALLDLPLDEGEGMLEMSPFVTGTKLSRNTDGPKIMPNPVSNELRIQADQAFSQVIIYTLDGREVFLDQFGETYSHTLAVMDFRPGMYIVHLRHQGQILGRLKFVKI